MKPIYVSTDFNGSITMNEKSSKINKSNTVEINQSLFKSIQIDESMNVMGDSQNGKKNNFKIAFLLYNRQKGNNNLNQTFNQDA